MDIMDILTPILYGSLIVLVIGLVVAVVVMLLRLTKTLKLANEMLANLDPTMKNVETLTTDLVPTVRKLEPVVDRVQLTLDSVNLELMRVDSILEDVGCALCLTTAALAEKAAGFPTLLPESVQPGGEESEEDITLDGLFAGGAAGEYTDAENLWEDGDQAFEGAKQLVLSEPLPPGDYKVFADVTSAASGSRSAGKAQS